MLKNIIKKYNNNRLSNYTKYNKSQYIEFQNNYIELQQKYKIPIELIILIQSYIPVKICIHCSKNVYYYNVKKHKVYCSLHCKLYYNIIKFNNYQNKIISFVFYRISLINNAVIYLSAMLIYLMLIYIYLIFIISGLSSFFGNIVNNIYNDIYYNYYIDKVYYLDNMYDESCDLYYYNQLFVLHNLVIYNDYENNVNHYYLD